MNPNAEEVRPIGRPPVGPKVQTAVPSEVHAFILLRARRTRQKQAAIVRSLIIAGYEATRGQARGGSR